MGWRPFPNVALLPTLDQFRSRYYQGRDLPEPYSYWCFEWLGWSRYSLDRKHWFRSQADLPVQTASR